MNVLRVITNCRLLLLDGTLAGTHRLTDVAADGARIGLGALAANRKALHVADTAVCADILEALNVGSDFTLEVTLNLEGLAELANLVLLFGGEVLCFGAVVEACLIEDLLRTSAADTENCGKSYFETLVVGDGDTLNTHRSSLGAV